MNSNDTPTYTPTAKPINEPDTDISVVVPSSDIPMHDVSSTCVLIDTPSDTPTCITSALLSDPRKRSRNDNDDDSQSPVGKRIKENDSISRDRSRDQSPSVTGYSPSKRKQENPKKNLNSPDKNLQVCHEGQQPSPKRQHVTNQQPNRATSLTLSQPSLTPPIVSQPPPVSLLPPTHTTVSRPSLTPPIPTNQSPSIPIPSLSPTISVLVNTTNQEVYQLINSLQCQFERNTLPGGGSGSVTSTNLSDVLSSIITSSPNQSAREIINKLSLPIDTTISSPELIRQILAAILKARAEANPDGSVSKRKRGGGSGTKRSTSTNAIVSGTVSPMSFADNIKLLQDFLQSKSILPSTITTISPSVNTLSTTNTPISTTVTTTIKPIATCNNSITTTISNTISDSYIDSEDPLPSTKIACPIIETANQNFKNDTNIVPITLLESTDTNNTVTHVNTPTTSISLPSIPMETDNGGQTIDQLAVSPQNGTVALCESNIVEDNIINKSETTVKGNHDDTDSSHSSLIPSLAQLAKTVVKKYSVNQTGANTSTQVPVVRPDTPPHNLTLFSPNMTPIGILKYTSQFDTPLSMTKVLLYIYT